MNAQLLIAFAAYFSILLAIGYFSYKKQTSSADFIMGNRSLNFWVIALSAHASDMSSWLFMGFPAAVYLSGLSQTWIAFGLLAGMYFNWQLVSTRLRTMTEHYDSYTLSTFFERRFQDQSGIIRLLTALISVFFLTCYLSAGLIGMGLLFESVFHIDYHLGLTLATCVVVAYTFVGGFITVAWTDLFQALFLLAVIILVPVTAFLNLSNGTESIYAVASAKEISLHFMPTLSMESGAAALFLIFGWGLGYFGQPHIVTKFMGIESAGDLKKSKYIGMTWMLIALSAAAAIGVIGIPFFEQGLHKPELIFVEMVKILFHPLAAGFILCGVLAASMSTMDSQILVCASVLSEDLYKHVMCKTASEKDLLKISRGAVILVSFLSLGIAFSKHTTVLDMVQYAWSGLGAAFGPLVLMSLYSKQANRYGAMAGICSGGILGAFWTKLNPLFTEHAVPAMIPGFFVSLLCIYVVSALTEKSKIFVQNQEIRPLPSED
jgi:sodium/proline symporter